MTQKELGLKAGFTNMTADSRIRKYESNLMAPKTEIRTVLANSLNIDLGAISDVCPTSYEDIMYIFFELEERAGMEIEKKNGKTCLCFDDQNEEIQLLIRYLNTWKNQKTAFLPNQKNASENQKKQYQIWKSRFKSNADAYDLNEYEIDSHYSPIIESIAATTPYCQTTSELTLLIREIIEAGFTVSTTYEMISSGGSGSGFIFVIEELLNPPTEEAEKLFARFKFELNHYVESGCQINADIRMYNGALTITYFIPVVAFTPVRLQIEKFLDFYKSEKSKDENAKERFEMDFQHDLKYYYNNIEEEIEIYKMHLP